MKISGQIVASFGFHHVVETETGQRYRCSVRGKRGNYVCGDKVEICLENEEQAVIEVLLPRYSLLYRQDKRKSKLIAANVDQIVLLFAPRPEPNEYFLQCGLLAARAAGIEPIVAVNKTDLLDFELYWERLDRWHHALGLMFVSVNAQKAELGKLPALLQGHHSALIGQSGVGKSTLLNALIPGAMAKIGSLSAHDVFGQNTTTYACRYALPNNAGSVMDIPGLQSFGLSHLSLDDLKKAFFEFEPYVEHCQFRDCRHDQEQQCGIKQAVQDGLILPERWSFWQSLSREHYGHKQHKGS